MRDKELEKVIHEYITVLYKAVYNGKLEVTNKDGIYILTLGVPAADIPTSISLQTEDPKEFLKYIKEELKSRDYMRVYFYKIKKTEELRKQRSKRKNGL